MRSIERWLPRMATASAPTTLPRNAVTSGEAPVARTECRHAQHRVARADAVHNSGRQRRNSREAVGLGVVTACRALPCVIITRGQSSFGGNVLGHFLAGQLLVARLQGALPAGRGRRSPPGGTSRSC